MVPKNPHVTCSFIGKKKEKFAEMMKKCEFREDEIFTITPTHLAYIPSKLITMKCKVSASASGRTLYVDNDHPHVTLGFSQKTKT